MSTCEKVPIKPRTQKDYKLSLSFVWNWISKQQEFRGQLTANPVKECAAYHDGLHVAKPKSGRLIVEGETNEIADWLTAVEQLDQVTREFFEFMLFSGCRLSEVTGLERPDIDWRRSLYKLHDPKNRRAVDLPEIPAFLKPRLRARKRKAGPVFPVTNLGRAQRKSVGEAIGKHWSNHDLRRTFSGIAQSVCPYTSVKRLTNRAYSDIIEVYIGDSANLQHELSKVEAKILQLGRPANNVHYLATVK